MYWKCPMCDNRKELVYKGNRNAADLPKKHHSTSLCGWKLLQDGHQCLRCLLGLLREQSVQVKTMFLLCSCLLLLQKQQWQHNSGKTECCLEYYPVIKENGNKAKCLCYLIIIKCIIHSLHLSLVTVKNFPGIS